MFWDTPFFLTLLGQIQVYSKKILAFEGRATIIVNKLKGKK
jgi:hypothetical protein